MGYIKKVCHCGNEYLADERNLKRGWGLSCSKSCAASKREKSKPGYDPIVVARNNRIREGRMTDDDWANIPLSRQLYLTHKIFGCDAPNVIGGSGRMTGFTSEGYRIMDGVAYDEFDDPVYVVSEFEDDDYSWDSHK